MFKKFASLCGFLLVVSFIITACGSSPASTVQATPTSPAPFQGNVTIKYVYDGVPETWMNRLPETKNVAVTYSDEDGWSTIKFDLMGYAQVTLFSLEVEPPNDDGEITFGGCRWEYTGSSWDDDSLLHVSDSFRGCTTLAPETVIPVDVTMAYCSQANDGLLCKKQNLTVFVGESYVSFSAEDAFLPQYREWLREVVQFKGGNGELPAVLQPNCNYTVTTP
jgi:hypothetical protein